MVSRHSAFLSSSWHSSSFARLWRKPPSPGVVNADRSTDLAGGLYGLRVSPSFWQAGDYRGYIRRSEVWGVMPDEEVK